MNLRFWTRLRDALRAVNRPPSAGWRDEYVHHGFRALLALGIALGLGFWAWVLCTPMIAVPYVLFGKSMATSQSVSPRVYRFAE